MPTSHEPSYATLRTAVTTVAPTSYQEEFATPVAAPVPQRNRTKSLAMCFTSTGAALSLPPKKKDIYR